MFHDNPLLAQLKQQLHAQTPRVEGTVKATDKNYGFLEVDNKTSYFIPPQQMRKVMDGDRIAASILTNNQKEYAEPEAIIDPALHRFIGRIQYKEKRITVSANLPRLKDNINIRLSDGVNQQISDGDWVVAKLVNHPLNDGKNFCAEITEVITHNSDNFTPWLVTTAYYQLDKEPPPFDKVNQLSDGDTQHYQDLTDFHFITIDGEETLDMDDAIYAQPSTNNPAEIELFVAIADPSLYIQPDHPSDRIAQHRFATNYLPGFTIPMLPKELADDLCSLKPNLTRPALICKMVISADGSLLPEFSFFNAFITSKDRLNYDQVSDWFENPSETQWQPNSELTAEQLLLLQQVMHKRLEWRFTHGVVFKDRPDYRFIIDDQGRLVDIIIEKRRSANRIIEEAMIAANYCAGQFLKQHNVQAIYNTHAGFESNTINQVIAILKENDLNYNSEELLSLDGFCRLRRQLDQLNNDYLEYRLRRFQHYAETSLSPAPHFGLGMDVYATWTSPIRKYSDLINHRLIKALINQQPLCFPSLQLLNQLNERRKINRQAERDICEWLYADYLAEKIKTHNQFSAEIIDINRGGMRVKLIENGAIAFVPALLIHPQRDELTCHSDCGMIAIKGQPVYRQGDQIEVMIEEIKFDSKNIVARPIEVNLI